MQVAVEPTAVEPGSGKDQETRQEQQKDRTGGLEFQSRYTERGVSPYDQVEWETRDAVITDEHGKTIFAQRGVEFPKSWSMMAPAIVPVASPVRMSRVWSVGTSWSDGVSTCFKKKNGRFRVNAVCTL